MPPESEGTEQSNETETSTESQETSSESQETESEKPEKTFTQSELEEILKKRLAKFKDFDALKSKASEYDKLADADKSESDKLKEELDKLKEQEQARVTKYQNVLRRSAILAEAKDLVDPQTAYELLMAKGFPGIEIDDDTDDVSGVAKALADLVKEKPFLKSAKFSPSVKGGPQNTGEEDISELSIEEYMRRSTPSNSKLAKVLDIG